MTAILSKGFLGRSVSVMALGVALALPAITGAIAQDKAPKAAGERPTAAAMFERYDTNNDGFIDSDELKAAREKKFEKLDTNTDGFIDAEELKAHQAKWQEKAKEKRLERIDNHVKRTEELFDKLDTNNDGSISREEYAVHVENAKERATKMRERLEKSEGEREAKGERKARHGKKHGGQMGMLMKLDADKDGKISKAEFEKGEQWLMKLDTDKDGKISKAEFEAGAKKFHKGTKGDKKAPR